jgi:hypothetical protein
MMHSTTPSSKQKRGSYKLLSLQNFEDDDGDIGVINLESLDPENFKVDAGDDDGELILPYEYEIARERVLVRKLDRRLMPCLFTMIVLK